MCPSNATGMKTLGSALRSPPSSQITPRGNLGRGDARVLELTEPSAGLGLGAPPLCRKGAWIFLEKPPLSAAGPVATPGHLGPTRLCARAGIGIVREKKPLSLGARGLQDGNPWSPITGETGTPGPQSLGRRGRLVRNHWGDRDAWSPENEAGAMSREAELGGRDLLWQQRMWARRQVLPWCSGCLSGQHSFLGGAWDRSTIKRL